MRPLRGRVEKAAGSARACVQDAERQTCQGPGDLEATVEHAHKSRRMFQEMPALELVSILGKYKPWNDSLITAYRHVQRQGHRSQVIGDGGRALCTPSVAFVHHGLAV